MLGKSYSPVALTALLLAGAPAWATLGVVPFTGGGAFSITDNILWYAGSSDGTPLNSFVLDSVDGPSAGGSFRAIDLTASFAKDGGSLENAISFMVTSSVTAAPPANTVYYLIVTSSNTQGSTPFPVAIAGIYGAPCVNGSNCFANWGALNVQDPGQGTSYYFAAPYTPTLAQTQVFIYPKDICTSGGIVNTGTLPQGCTGDTTAQNHQTAALQKGTTNTGTGNSTMSLTFQVVSFAPNSALPTALPSPAADSATVNLRFEDNGRTNVAPVSCPPNLIPYYPGDGKITVDTTAFDPIRQPAASGYAPITTTLVAGKPNSNLGDTTGSGISFAAGQPSGFPGDLQVFGRTGVSSGEDIPGFTNLTAPSDPAHSYDVGFLVRDAAGMLYTPTANTSAIPGQKDGCVLVGVQTSAIQGFLSKSSCFIATAAFRSIDAGPVAMLRQFRDRILFKSVPGTAFVHWYYRWSPPAAEWLMLHPRLRYPVLAALVPLEIAAWLILHPLALLFSLLGFALLGGGLLILGLSRDAAGVTE